MGYDIKFSPPDISEEEISEVIDTLRSGWITTGPKTKLFERKIAEFYNTSKAVCLNSATACMELTLRLLGIGPEDEVITSAYTYTASCSVICHVGAKPVLVDTQNESFEMDYSKLENAITDKTKAIIPVDIGGVMCDYSTISNIIDSKKSLFAPKNDIQNKIGRIVILEDAAHAFGASQNGVRGTKISDFACFSFHAVKNITTSEGGAVIWKSIPGISDEEIYKNFMLLSLHGQSKDALSKSQKGNWEYDIKVPGYKCNMTDIMASIGIAQLRRYDELDSKRQKICQIYDESFKDQITAGKIAVLNHLDAKNISSKHLYMVRILGKDENFRNSVILKMTEKGIGVNVHYKPLPMHTAYKNMGFDIKDYPNAFNLYRNEVTLPLHTLLKDEEVGYVAEEFKKIINA